MSWHDLLFAHWPLPPENLREILPPALDLDTYQGRAWIGVVPFRMTGVRLRFLPPFPGLSTFPEINVRTYVIARGGRPGVYFFSLHAANRVAVAAARRIHLNYFHARMSVSHSGGRIHYQSRRHAAEFVANYKPRGAVFYADRGSLVHWLTERYCLCSTGSGGRAFRLDIQHPRWALQEAEAEVQLNTMTTPLGIQLPAQAPLLHFAAFQKVVAWWPVRM